MTTINLLERCPVTKGVPVTMQESAFRKICEQYRAKKHSQYNVYVHQYCRTCRGRIHPPGLTFKTKEEMMAENKTCESCGKDGIKLSSHYGAMVCSVCTNIRSIIKNNPELVMRTMHEFHNITIDTEVAKLKAEIKEKNEVIDKLLLEVDKFIPEIGEINIDNGLKDKLSGILWSILMGRIREPEKVRIPVQIMEQVKEGIELVARA